MVQQIKAVEWEPGDPISEAQDRSRRKFSPCFGEYEREEYERQLYKARLERGDDSTEEELHRSARIETAFAAPNADDADRARRHFSPEIREDEREEYDREMRVECSAMGHVFTEKQVHFGARMHVLNKRSDRYQQKVGAMKLIEAQQKKTSKHTQKMRDKRAENVAAERAANRESAEQAIEWAHRNFPMANEDDSLDFLKRKAADHLGITKRALNARLKK